MQDLVLNFIEVVPVFFKIAGYAQAQDDVRHIGLVTCSPY